MGRRAAAEPQFTLDGVPCGGLDGPDGFFAANEHLETAEVAAIRALAVGEAYTGDEGAGGTWTIARVS